MKIFSCTQIEIRIDLKSRCFLSFSMHRDQTRKHFEYSQCSRCFLSFSRQRDWTNKWKVGILPSNMILPSMLFCLFFLICCQWTWKICKACYQFELLEIYLLGILFSVSQPDLSLLHKYLCWALSLCLQAIFSTEEPLNVALANLIFAITQSEICFGLKTFHTSGCAFICLCSWVCLSPLEKIWLEVKEDYIQKYHLLCCFVKCDDPLMSQVFTIFKLVFTIFINY